jgi:2-methylisocitrate lyase-like PEP mutase family enzyme
MEAKQVHIDMSDALDQCLLTVLKQGTPLMDESGRAVMDADNKPIMIPPTAAMLQAVRGRLRDLGVDKMRVPGSTIDEMAKAADEAAKKIADHETAMGNYQFPKIADESVDDAATAHG